MDVAFLNFVHNVANYNVLEKGAFIAVDAPNPFTYIVLTLGSISLVMIIDSKIGYLSFYKKMYCL